MGDQLPRCRYSIDKHDLIEMVDETWLAFARENGAARLTRDRVIGKSLWSFIQGNATRQFYEAIFENVRQQSGIAVVPFRCDSPNLLREMRLIVKAGDDDAIHLEGILCRVQLTRYLHLLDARARRSREKLTICSLCKRTLVEPMGWIEMSETAVQLRLYGDRLQPKVTYSLCPACVLHAHPSPC